MAIVDARLTNATFYDVTRFDVVKGQVFSLTLIDWPDESRWVSENDPVLEIVHAPGNEGEITAKELGISTIWMFEKAAFGEQPKVIKELLITVVAEILPMVSDLGLSVSIVDKI